MYGGVLRCKASEPDDMDVHVCNGLRTKKM